MDHQQQQQGQQNGVTTYYVTDGYDSITGLLNTNNGVGSVGAAAGFGALGAGVGAATGFGAGEGVVGAATGSGDAAAHAADESYESRSGSETYDAFDEQDGDNRTAVKRKKYHRHTPQQIQELENFFKECPHPDEKQRLDLGRRLGLESKQVKFWFQNRRTQLKTQLERHENVVLKQEYDKLRADNMRIKEALSNPLCQNCGGPNLAELTVDESQLRLENARLKDELVQVCAMTEKLLGRPITDIIGPVTNPMAPGSSNSNLLDLSVGRSIGGPTESYPTTDILALGPIIPPPPSAADMMMNNMNSNINGRAPQLPYMNNNPDALTPMASSPALGTNTYHQLMDGGAGPSAGVNNNNGTNDYEKERGMYLQVALAAMDELITLAQASDTLWLKEFTGTKEILNYEEYTKKFSPFLGNRPLGFTTDATKDTASAFISALELVNTLMDPKRWAELFLGMVGKIHDVTKICCGSNGTRDGELLMIQAELLFPSPMVPLRQVKFLRYAKQQAENVWVVADVSTEIVGATSLNDTSLKNRRLPSGCIIQGIANGSVATWVEHVEYDETVIPNLYKPSLLSGLAFGAQRWLATLQRERHALAYLTTKMNPELNLGMSAEGKKSILKLTRRIIASFCAGICGSSLRNWEKIETTNLPGDIQTQVLTRASINEPGEPSGIILSAATAIWIPIPRQQIFDFLRHEQFRGNWDILSSAGPMLEMTRISKDLEGMNRISLLCTPAGAENPMNMGMVERDSQMLIIQEAFSDKSGSAIVYAPVDAPTMDAVINGGDSDYLALLPSGFVITDAFMNNGINGGGSLLTIAFQILVNSLPTAKITAESIETVNNLISCTVHKIKAAFHCM